MRFDPKLMNRCHRSPKQSLSAMQTQHPITPQGRRRRFLTRRNFFIATIAAAIGLVALILIILIVYRLGYVDRYVAGQIKDTFAKYGIRAEIKEFHAAFPPQTVEMLGVELYDAQSGEKLGQINRLLATIRIEDLYALNLQRNINLKDLKIEGLEAWVTFDEQGRSNFATSVFLLPKQTGASFLPIPLRTLRSRAELSTTATRAPKSP